MMQNTILSIIWWKVRKLGIYIPIHVGHWLGASRGGEMLILIPFYHPCMWAKWISMFLQQRYRYWPLEDRLPNTEIVRGTIRKGIERWCVCYTNLSTTIATHVSYPIFMPTFISNPQTKNQYIVIYKWIKLEKSHHVIPIPISTPTPQKSPGLDSFTGEFYKTSSKELTRI